MKTVDYFRQAAQDPAFRAQKLDDLRYFRTVSLGLLVFMVVVDCGCALYIGLEEGWHSGFEAGAMWFPIVVVNAYSYSRYDTLIAALEAMSPNPSAVDPGLGTAITPVQR
jgi:hypothetical protein